MITLSDKLKALGVKVGARDLPPPSARRDVHAIEQLMPGRLHTTTHGESFVVETIYSPDYRHGQFGLQTTASLHPIAE